LKPSRAREEPTTFRGLTDSIIKAFSCQATRDSSGKTGRKQEQEDLCRT